MHTNIRFDITIVVADRCKKRRWGPLVMIKRTNARAHNRTSGRRVRLRIFITTLLLLLLVDRDFGQCMQRHV